MGLTKIVTGCATGNCSSSVFGVWPKKIQISRCLLLSFRTFLKIWLQYLFKILLLAEKTQEQSASKPVLRWTYMKEKTYERSRPLWACITLYRSKGPSTPTTITITIKYEWMYRAFNQLDIRDFFFLQNNVAGVIMILVSNCSQPLLCQLIHGILQPLLRWSTLIAQSHIIILFHTVF